MDTSPSVTPRRIPDAVRTVGAAVGPAWMSLLLQDLLFIEDAGQNPRFFLNDRPGCFPKRSSSLHRGLLSHPGAGGPPASSLPASDRLERKGYP